MPSTQTSPVIETELNQWLAAIPKTSVQQRMKVSLKILGARKAEKPSENKVSWSTGDIIFIFRALQQSGIIMRDQDQSKIAVALEILTGKSHTVFNNHFIHADEKEFDLRQIFNTGEDKIPGIKKSVIDIAKEVKKSLDNLIQEFQSPSTGKSEQP